MNIGKFFEIIGIDLFPYAIGLSEFKPVARLSNLLSLWE